MIKHHDSQYTLVRKDACPPRARIQRPRLRLRVNRLGWDRDPRRIDLMRARLMKANHVMGNDIPENIF